jgi:hypothetical protein
VPKNRILRTTAAAIVFAGIGLAGFLQCTRDNPFDPGSKDHITGTAPMVSFAADTVTGFIWDSISVSVAFSDTQALGGKTPGVEMLYFNWFGNSANLNDSVSAAALANPTTVFKVFWLILPNNKVYVRARDNDGNLSPLDSMWLTVDIGRSKIDSASVSVDTVVLGDSLTFTASAHDTNGTIRDFVWTVGGVDTTTTAGVLKVLFRAEGMQNVIVRSRDNDWVFSLPDTLRITVTDRAGPAISFWSPTDPDTVNQSSQTIIVETRDPSGIFTLWINGTTATKLDTTAYPGWQKWQTTVTLIEGNNSIPVWSWDRSPGNNQSRDTLHLLYTKPDNIPPSIVFSTPQPGDTVRDTLNPSSTTIMVNVSDPSGVAWVRCNGVAMSSGPGNIYTRDLMLAEGANAIIITAADVPGNDTINTLNVTYRVFHDNTPPTLRITAPQNGRQIAGDSVNVIVLASDTGTIKSGMDSVNVNGARAPDTVMAGIVHYMLKIPLVHGYDTIRVSAVDSSGNRTVDSVIVIRNALPRFYPDVIVKDTNLWLDTASTLTFVATDADGDVLFFDTISAPKKNDSTPYMVPEAPGYAHLAGYVPNSIGLDTFKVKVVDSWGGVDTLKVSVMILQKTSSKPYFTISTLPDTAILDSLYTVQLTATDPNDSPLVYSKLAPPTPSGVSISPAGLVTWTPAILGLDTIAAMVANGIPESDTLTWAVTVVRRNYPPVLRDPGDKTVDEGQLLQFTLVASDTNGDPLVYSFGSMYPAGATLDSVTGVFSWTPGYRQAGVYPVVFTVTEQGRVPALADSVSDTITVVNVNYPPVLVNPGNKTVNEGSALTFVLQATDPNNDSITFTMSGAPVDSGAQIVNNSTFTWTPSVRAAGVYPITFIATDNGSPIMADSVTDTITVADATVPMFKGRPFPMDTTLCGYPYITIVSASDGDNDSMTYTKLIGPDSLYVGATNGIIGWMPKTAGLQEIVPVSVAAEDHAGNRDTLSWLILVARWPRILMNPAANDTGFSVVQTRDGGYAVCGTVADTGRTYSVGIFMKTDNSGNLIGSPVTYPGTNSHLALYSMQQTTDNGFIMCGTDISVAGATARMALLRTDPNGNPLWFRTDYLDTTGTYPLTGGMSVIQTADGGFAACGVAARAVALPASPVTSGFAVKTNATGAMEWNKVYINLLRASLFHCIQQPAEDLGSFVMCGEIKAGGGTSTTRDVYLVKTLPNRGDTLWTRAYAAGGDEVALSIVRTVGAKEYILGGFAAAGNINAGMLMKVKEGGDTVWVRALPINTAVTSVTATLDGDYVACGIGVDGLSGGTNGADALLCRFTTAGIIPVGWPKFHGAGLNDGAFCVSPTADGGFVCTGFATTVIGSVTTDIYLAKVSKTGDLELNFDGIH